jgi:AAA domain
MPADLAAHIEVVARRLLGEPNRALSSRDQWRYGSHGSFAVEVGGTNRGTWYDHERAEGGGVLDLIHRETGLADGAAVEWLKSELGIRLDEQPHQSGQRRIVAAYDYHDESGALLFQVVRFEPKDFRQRRPDGNGGWTWSVKGIRPVPYRLPELLERPEDAPVFIVEGEKDADRLASLGLVATCNAGGAGKWRAELSAFLRAVTVYVVADNDDAGRAHAKQVANSLHGVAAAVRIVQLPSLPPKGDVSDWLDAGGTVEQLQALCEAAPLWEPDQPEDGTENDGGLGEWDAGDDDAPIPPRGWLLANTFCRGFLSSLIAAGGTGKSAVRIAQALAMATGRPLTGEHVFRRCRVLLISLEDGRDELRRRVRAAMMHHGISAADVKGWLFLAAKDHTRCGDEWKLATAKNGEVHRSQLADRIEDTIVRRKIDVVSIDPLVKAHGVDENDNNQIDQVVAILVGIAIEHDCAVDAPHHTNKLLTEPGNANSARGASAFKDGGRLAYTLLPMTPDEAQTFGVPEEERRRLVRMDSAKVNIVPAAASAKWFRLASVNLDNATPDYPHGDSLQVVEPWTPPDFWKDLPPSRCRQIIDAIDAGTEDGERFSAAAAAKKRAAWPVVCNHAPQLTEKQAREVVKTWLKNGVLEEREYHSETERGPIGAVREPGEAPGRVRQWVIPMAH